MLLRIEPELMARIKHFASFPQTGVSLKQMVEFGRAPSQGTLLRASQFLAEELPIRLAHRVVELDQLPDDLSKMPSVVHVKHWYAESFQELIRFPRYELPRLLKEKYRIGSQTNNGLLHRYYAPFELKDGGDLPADVSHYNRDFTRLIEAIKRRHDPVVMTIAQGILEWKSSRKTDLIHPSMQSFLDRFYLSRIGIRVLIGQHIALQAADTEKDHVGIICTATSLCRVAQEAADNARFICEDHYGLFNAPEVQIHCPKDLKFMYVPSHLHHILFELLKNSLRAVVEWHGVETETYPPIKLIVAEGREDITIKISDEGGGIPRSGMDLIWTYMYTTAQTPLLSTGNQQQSGPQTADFKAPMAGYGYGLPLSRLYARYFGGDLRLISMEGYGTDAYVHLSRLSDTEEPLP